MVIALFPVNFKIFPFYPFKIYTIISERNLIITQGCLFFSFYCGRSFETYFLKVS